MIIVPSLLVSALFFWQQSPPAPLQPTSNPPKAQLVSLSTTPLFTLKKNVVIGQASGFFVAKPLPEGTNAVVLVTNRHVVLGETDDGTPDLPDRIKFACHTSQDEPMRLREISLPLYTPEGKPIWITSTKFPDADLVVIPLPSPWTQGCSFVMLDVYAMSKTQIKIKPTSSVTIVGYPLGFYDMLNGLPIWKTGSVASEPDFDFGGRPMFLVDISVFQGMSGSPVIAVPSGGVFTAESGIVVVGDIQRFLGVFGALRSFQQNAPLRELPASKALGAQVMQSMNLAYVWKAELLLSLLDEFNPPLWIEEIAKHLRPDA